MIRNARLALTRIAVVLAAVAALAVVAPHHAASGTPLPLTLTNAHGWTPAAKLDATQVEAPDPSTTDPADVEPVDPAAIAALYVLLDQRAKHGDHGITRMTDAEFKGCLLVVGGTSVVVCPEGWMTTS